jgi:hypothetical protein
VSRVKEWATTGELLKIKIEKEMRITWDVNIFVIGLTNVIPSAGNSNE